MNCSVGFRHGLDLVLLWLWCGLAAIVPIQPLAQELPYVVGAALKKKKERKKEKEISEMFPSNSLNSGST